MGHYLIRVLLDISVLGLSMRYESAKTGVFRVVENLVRGLAINPNIELMFCSTQHLPEQDPDSIDACQEYLETKPHLKQIPFYKNNLPQADIFHSPYYALPPNVSASVRFLTIYDLIPTLFPQFFPCQSANMQQNVLSLVRPDDHLISISQATKVDLCRVAEINPDRVTVTHLAADPAIFYPCDNSDLLSMVRQKYSIGIAPYILSLCTLEPRKNIDHVIRAFARLVRISQGENIRLVLTGTMGWDFNRIFSEIDDNPELQTRIILTGFVPDEDLSPLYSGALAFVYMSLYEGFGLPPLEAMQCGIPVITSNTSSLPEVVGDAGIMLDPTDESGLCQAIVEICTDKQKRREFALKALKQAQFFSWEQTVSKTVEAYRFALKSACLSPFAQPKTKGSQLIIIDGVFFQLMTSGIARVWRSLLMEWSHSDFSPSLLLLDRAGTAPQIPGIRTRIISEYDYNATERDRSMLQAICNEERAELFISTYYSSPLTTPSIFVVHDMIPEHFSGYFNLDHPMWREKHWGIEHASAFIAVSKNTALDLVRFYPPSQNALFLAYNGVDKNVFSPAMPQQIQAFKNKNLLNKPYILYLGSRQSYKNAKLLFEGFKLLNTTSLEIVCIGGMPTLESYLEQIIPNNVTLIPHLSDEELRVAYSGAVAFVYPSLYEGFGLPILEAMSCDCPVITCQNSSLPEVAGAAALYITSDSPDEMAVHLKNIQNIEIRNHLIKLGRRQVQKFSWSKMAGEVQEAMVKTCESLRRV